MGWSITAETVKPITDALASGLDVLVPVGIGVMAVMIGITLIPKVIYRFI